MKKQLLGLMTILTFCCACQKNEVTSLSEDVTIHAKIEDKDTTKTVMDESNNVLWSENDQIIAFMKSSYGHKYQVKPSFVGKSYADFSMVSSGNGSDLSIGNEWEHNVVYYPYSENVECLKSGSNYALDVNLHSEQVYVPDSFANGSMAMVAVSEDNNIAFKNILGGIKLQLKGTQTVKSIKIEGKNNEKLSGPAVVTAYTDGKKPTITMASDAFDSVTLNCNSGVQLNEEVSTNFIIVLPPILFSQGFSVTITDASSRTYTITTDKVNTVSRSSLLVMPEITLESSYPPLSDYIDEYGINHGKGVKIDEVIWAPVNCGYHKDDFMYGKLYQWGRKYGQGYSLEYDATEPIMSHDDINITELQDEVNQNYIYLEWEYLINDLLWNTGSEENPKKSEYDPCPNGWRVPSELELLALVNESYKQNYIWGKQETITGAWFGGFGDKTENRIFLPAAGSYSLRSKRPHSRDEEGYYLTSTKKSVCAYNYRFNASSGAWYVDYPIGSVRCVQE